MPDLAKFTVKQLEEERGCAMVRLRREEKYIAEIDHELSAKKARKIHGVGAATADAHIPPAT